MERFGVSGCFLVEVEAKDYIEAREITRRILANEGIVYRIVDVRRGANGQKTGKDSISGTEKAG
jgi:hypothetical protein